MALYWDNTLLAPIAGRAVPPSVTPYAPPPAAVPVPPHLAFCGDRPNHFPLNQNPCSDNIWNPAANAIPPPPPAANWIGNPHNWYRRRHCPGHFPHDTSCGYCRGHTVGQPWYTAILNDVLTPPDLVPALGGGLPIMNQPLQGPFGFRGFLTYLCLWCEQDEQSLWVERKNLNIQALSMGDHTLFRRGTTRGFPNSTCTCLGHLEGPNNYQYCIQCRHNRACTCHDQRLRRRMQSDNWLRNIQATPGGVNGATRMLT